MKSSLISGYWYVVDKNYQVWNDSTVDSNVSGEMYLGFAVQNHEKVKLSQFRLSHLQHFQTTFERSCKI